MAKRQKTIIRNDIICKAAFCRKFHVSAHKLNDLIADGMLQIEVISHIPYISIADRAVLDAALSYKSRHQGSWARGGTANYKKTYSSNTWEAQMERDWELSQQ